MIEQARQIALDAGRLLTAKLKSGITIEHKGSIDLVTDADRAAEEYIVGQIQSMFPHHGILGEEGARIEGTSEFLWVIDPLDGTTNFAHGLPYFSREFRSNICCPDTEMSCRTTLQDIFFCVLIHFYVA